MKKFVKYLLLTAVFLFSFVLFAYISFPKKILRDRIVHEISNLQVLKTRGVLVSINSVDTIFPIGLRFKGIKLSQPGAYLYQKSSSEVPRPVTMRFRQLDVSLNLFSLFLGNLNSEVTLQDGRSGDLAVEVGISILDLIASNPVPNLLRFDAKNFNLDQYADVAVYLAAQMLKADSKRSGDYKLKIVADLLEKSGFKGNLNSASRLTFDSSNLRNSSGKIDIRITKGVVALGFKGVRTQVFKKADVVATLSSGNLTLSPKTLIESNELVVKLSGRLSQKKILSRSQLNFKAVLNVLETSVEEGEVSLRNSMDMVANMVNMRDGTINFELGGTIGNPKFKFL